MASQTHVKRALLCFSLITLSFVFFFFLNDTPKNEDTKILIGTKKLPSDVISTVEVRGKYTPPESWTKFEGQRSETEEELESAILGVDAPIAAAEVVGDAGIDINVIRNGVVDEEKLREKLVMEDPTWVSWQKMNQVRYLSLLTGIEFSFGLLSSSCSQIISDIISSIISDTISSIVSNITSHMIHVLCAVIAMYIYLSILCSAVIIIKPSYLEP
jgi:hypothetical protein